MGGKKKKGGKKGKKKGASTAALGIRVVLHAVLRRRTDIRVQRGSYMLCALDGRDHILTWC